jgi:hypothetical protein
VDQPLHDIRINVPHTPKPRHAFALSIVAIIHAGLIYALAVGLATGVIQKKVEEIKVAVTPPKLEKAAPPPPPDLAKPPPPVVPAPEIVVQQPAPAAMPNIQTRPIVEAPSPPRRRPPWRPLRRSASARPTRAARNITRKARNAFTKRARQQ